MLYLSFSLEHSMYAIPVKHVEESVQNLGITRIPMMPGHVLGVMNLRGSILPVYDSRLRLGIKSDKEERKELIHSLKLRKQEHIDWLDTLKRQVDNEEEITVQRDPSLCNFGKWYNRYMSDIQKRTTDTHKVDNILLSTLKKFEKPHNEIHAVADQAQRYIKSGDTNAAKQLIKQEGTTVLNRMIELFESIEQVILSQQQREVIVVIRKGKNHFGLTVDALDSTVDIEDIQNTEYDNEVIQAIGVKGEQIIKLLDLDKFVGV